MQMTTATPPWRSLVLIVVAVWLTGLLHNMPVVVMGVLIIVAVVSIIDLGELHRIRTISNTAFVVAMASFGSVLAFGVLEGVLIGVGCVEGSTQVTGYAPLVQLGQHAQNCHRAVAGLAQHTYHAQPADLGSAIAAISALGISRHADQAIALPIAQCIASHA